MANPPFTAISPGSPRRIRMPVSSLITAPTASLTYCRQCALTIQLAPRQAIAGARPVRPVSLPSIPRTLRNAQAKASGSAALAVWRARRAWPDESRTTESPLPYLTATTPDPSRPAGGPTSNSSSATTFLISTAAAGGPRR